MAALLAALVVGQGLPGLASADDAASHADGTSCSDSGEEPCDEGCACTCCHGRTTMLASPGVARAGGRPPTGPRAIAPPDDLLPADVVRRIDRPPRRPA